MLMPGPADARARGEFTDIEERGCMQTAAKWQCSNTGNGKSCWLVGDLGRQQYFGRKPPKKLS